MFNSISNLEFNAFSDFAPYNPPGLFFKLFRPWIDLSGEPCPIGPSPDNKPKIKAERRKYVRS